jgi:hypothetical protein
MVCKKLLIHYRLTIERQNLDAVVLDVGMAGSEHVVSKHWQPFLFFFNVVTYVTIQDVVVSYFCTYKNVNNQKQNN